MFDYKVNIRRVIDGDTVDVDVDLGFGVILSNERVRLNGIDAPESRTSNKKEKLFGLAAKNKLKELLSSGDCILVSEKYDSRGKFGRILGDITVDGKSVSRTLIGENYAVEYYGQNKSEIEELHLENRKILLESGVVDSKKYSKIK